MSLRASKAAEILKKLIDLEDDAKNRLNSNGVFSRMAGRENIMTHVKVPAALFEEIERAYGNVNTFLATASVTPIRETVYDPNGNVLGSVIKHV
tara:strand:+ start:934 stop:1215 length:282 start_codon:yes stop_codon:yes gene_type:complete